MKLFNVLVKITKGICKNLRFQTIEIQYYLNENKWIEIGFTTNKVGEGYKFDLPLIILVQPC